MKTARANAKERMAGFCRIFPFCNGRACAGEVPGMGGIGTGSAFRANLTSLAAWRLNMRLLHDIENPDPSTTILGLPLAMPVLAAPIGGVAFNMGGRCPRKNISRPSSGAAKPTGSSAAPETLCRHSSMRPS
jgi:hypothetical protein